MERHGASGQEGKRRAVAVLNYLRGIFGGLPPLLVIMLREMRKDSLAKPSRKLVDEKIFCLI